MSAKLISKITSSSYLILHIYKRLSVFRNHPNHLTHQRQLINYGFDVILGACLYVLLSNMLVDTDISGEVVAMATLVKSSLDKLLQWLMGAPAGLKLNHELSYFLGNFFLYHVEIWMTYLLLIGPYLRAVWKILLLSNWLGVSMFVSLLSDIVNGLTFHMYCFYVYAANLYRVQLQALVSLARLFRGRLINVICSIP